MDGRASSPYIGSMATVKFKGRTVEELRRDALAAGSMEKALAKLVAITREAIHAGADDVAEELSYFPAEIMDWLDSLTPDERAALVNGVTPEKFLHVLLDDIEAAKADGAWKAARAMEEMRDQVLGSGKIRFQ